MKHSNVFYTSKTDGTFEIAKDAVAVRNKAGFDLFRVKPKFNISEGQTGSRISNDSSMEEMLATVEKINTDQSYQERLRKAIEEQLAKTGVSPRYTRPEERREDFFPTPPKEKTMFVQAIGSDLKRHRYIEDYQGDDFSLYAKVGDAGTDGHSLYLLYEGWMLDVGSSYERDAIIAKLSEGIPDFRQKMQDEVEACMADPKKWVNVSFAAFLDRLEEARAHNQICHELREPERAAQRAKLAQQEAERNAALEAKYQSAIKQAEHAIATHGRLVDDKNLRGTSLMLQLFRLHGIYLPLRTQGWVKSALFAIEYRNGNWCAQIFNKHKPSATFWERFDQLEEVISRKYARGSFTPPEEEAEDGWER